MSWFTTWGTTPAERMLPLQGDDFVAPPAAQVTRAITIDAPPEQIWPWLVQIGADRGGFYSYDWLENLFRLGIHSADELVPEWQERAVGDLVYANAKGSGGWYVMEVRRNEALVLQTANVKQGRTSSRTERGELEFVWIFVLRPLGDGRTRLVIRERTSVGGKLLAVLMWPMGIASFVMTRKMLYGLKARAERGLTS